MEQEVVAAFARRPDHLWVVTLRGHRNLAQNHVAIADEMLPVYSLPSRMKHLHATIMIHLGLQQAMHRADMAVRRHIRRTPARINGPCAVLLVACTHRECEPQFARPPGTSATHMSQPPSADGRIFPPAP